MYGFGAVRSLHLLSMIRLPVYGSTVLFFAYWWFLRYCLVKSLQWSAIATYFIQTQAQNKSLTVIVLTEGKFIPVSSMRLVTKHTG